LLGILDWYTSRLSGSMRRRGVGRAARRFVLLAVDKPRNHAQAQAIYVASGSPYPSSLLLRC